MNLEALTGFIRREIDSLVNDALRPPRNPDSPPNEAGLIERATYGAEARQWLESRVVQDYVASQEAKLMHQLVSLPLDDDIGRRNLALAIQSVRQCWKYMTTAAQDGRAAEAELERLQKRGRQYF